MEQLEKKIDNMKDGYLKTFFEMIMGFMWMPEGTYMVAIAILMMVLMAIGMMLGKIYFPAIINNF